MAGRGKGRRGCGWGEDGVKARGVRCP